MFGHPVGGLLGVRVPGNKVVPVGTCFLRGGRRARVRGTNGGGQGDSLCRMTMPTSCGASQPFIVILRVRRGAGRRNRCRRTGVWLFSFCLFRGVI